MVVTASDCVDAEPPVDEARFSHNATLTLPGAACPLLAQRVHHLEAFERGIGRLHQTECRLDQSCS